MKNETHSFISEYRSIYFKLVKHNVVLWTGIVANIVTEKQTPTRNLITYLRRNLTMVNWLRAISSKWRVPEAHRLARTGHKTFFRREVTLTHDASIDTENENEKIDRKTKDDNHKPFIFTLCRAISGYYSTSLSFQGDVPSSLPSPSGPSSAQLTI